MIIFIVDYLTAMNYLGTLLCWKLCKAKWKKKSLYYVKKLKRKLDNIVRTQLDGIISDRQFFEFDSILKCYFVCSVKRISRQVLSRFENGAPMSSVLSSMHPDASCSLLFVFSSLIKIFVLSHPEENPHDVYEHRF